jgi:amino acid permease
MSWLQISIVHIRFRRAYLAQGYHLSELPYKSCVGVVGDYIAITAISLIIIFSGIAPYFIDGSFSVVEFIKNYISIFLYPILYFIYKIFYGSKLVPLLDCDFTTGNVCNIDNNDAIKLTSIKSVNSLQSIELTRIVSSKEIKD